VINALRDLQDRLQAGPWFLAGYSLGGNFSLRVALNAEQAGLNLAQVVAICPVINPANAMSAMEQGLRFYEWYFERKWSRSLRTKQDCFHDCGKGRITWPPNMQVSTVLTAISRVTQ